MGLNQSERYGVPSANTTILPIPALSVGSIKKYIPVSAGYNPTGIGPVSMTGSIDFWTTRGPSDGPHSSQIFVTMQPSLDCKADITRSSCLTPPSATELARREGPSLIENSGHVTNPSTRLLVDLDALSTWDFMACSSHRSALVSATSCRLNQKTRTAHGKIVMMVEKMRGQWTKNLLPCWVRA